MSWKDFLRPAIFELAHYRPFEYRPGLVRLDANESAFSLDPEEQELLARELSQIDLRRYPEVSARPLREALASRLGVSPDEILLGNGSDEIIAILIAAFGEERKGVRAKVLYPTPTFGEYESVARAYGAEPLPVPLDSRWELDEPRLAEVIEREQPALAFFASPNNPTGNHFDPAVLDRLSARFPGCFVVDEAYADFEGKSQLPKVRQREGFCVMKSLSKIGLAGLRLGLLVGARDLITQLDKVRLPYNVNAVSTALACALFANPARLDARIKRVAEVRRNLETGLASVPNLTAFPSDSNFVLVRVPDAGKTFEQLLGRRILVRNLSRPGPLQNCLRITAGTEKENELCVEALRAVLA
jgi:histidinol-phosphate aminotransferase